MGNIEFINFIATPNEKHLGIATIRIDRRFMVRYKIAQAKNGNGFFPSAASFKITDDQGERYVSAFMVDSNFEKEEIEEIIKTNVRKCMATGSSTPSQQSSSSKGSMQNQDSHEDVPF